MAPPHGVVSDSRLLDSGRLWFYVRYHRVRWSSSATDRGVRWAHSAARCAACGTIPIEPTSPVAPAAQLFPVCTKRHGVAYASHCVHVVPCARRRARAGHSSPWRRASCHPRTWLMGSQRASGRAALPAAPRRPHPSMPRPAPGRPAHAEPTQASARAAFASLRCEECRRTGGRRERARERGRRGRRGGYLTDKHSNGPITLVWISNRSGYSC